MVHFLMSETMNWLRFFLVVKDVVKVVTGIEQGVEGEGGAWLMMRGRSLWRYCLGELWWVAQFSDVTNTTGRFLHIKRLSLHVVGQMAVVFFFIIIIIINLLLMRNWEKLGPFRDRGSCRGHEWTGLVVQSNSVRARVADTRLGLVHFWVHGSSGETWISLVSVRVDCFSGKIMPGLVGAWTDGGGKL